MKQESYNEVVQFKDNLLKINELMQEMNKIWLETPHEDTEEMTDIFSANYAFNLCFDDVTHRVKHWGLTVERMVEKIEDKREYPEMTTLIRKLEFEDFQLKITYESPVWTIDIDNAYRVQNMHDKTIKITIIDKPEHHWSMTVYGVEDTFAEILKLGL